MRIAVWLFIPLAYAASPVFVEHLIDTGLKGGYQVVVTDMNHDGKPDLIALASGMKDLVWYENPSWKKHVIVGGQKAMINVAAWDTDGDGIPELVLATEFSSQAKNSIGVLAFLERREDPDAPWRVTEIDRLTTSHRLRWANIDGSGKRVLVNAPLTGATAEAPDYRGHTPLVFYRPGEWKRELIGEQNEGVVHGLCVTDWDGDGRDQILTAAMSGIALHKYNKNGTWTRTEIAQGDPAPWPKSGASDLAVGSIRGQKFIASIEPWHGNQTVIYRQEKGKWARQVIDSALVDGHTVQVGDFDGDGTDEVIAGYRGGDHSLILYQADKAGKKWGRTVLDRGGMGAAACAVADLNGDGKADIACIGSATANLKWYENRTAR